MLYELEFGRPLVRIVFRTLAVVTGVFYDFTQYFEKSDSVVLPL